MAETPPPADKKWVPPCPKCGSTNVKETGLNENAYGELISDYKCNDCKHEWERLAGGISLR